VYVLLHFAWVVDDAKCIVVTRVCVSVCLSVRGRMPTLLHGPGCNLGNGGGWPLVVHYGADLQSGHGLHCYGNITRTRNVSEYMLVLALCLVVTAATLIFIRWSLWLRPWSRAGCLTALCKHCERALMPCMVVRWWVESVLCVCVRRHCLSTAWEPDWQRGQSAGVPWWVQGQRRHQ